jgi:uncharacterized delta-60 repeat protein
VGELVSSFGVGGVLRNDLPGYQANAIWDLAVLHGITTDVSDDQILVLETPSNSSYWAIGLARLTPFGQLDATYGTNGGRTITAGTDSLPAWKMAARQDGSVIVTGRIDYAGNVSPADGFLASYTSTGLPDTGFGTCGLATFGINGGDAGYAVVIDPGPTTSPADDKIYVTGSCQGGSTGFLARFDGNTGLLDPTFGTNGIVLQQGLSYDLAIQPDGKVVTITTRSTTTKRGGTTYEFLVYRYNAN